MFLSEIDFKNQTIKNTKKKKMFFWIYCFGMIMPNIYIDLHLVGSCSTGLLKWGHPSLGLIHA
jgi:hypothetical protein